MEILKSIERAAAIEGAINFTPDKPTDLGEIDKGRRLLNDVFSYAAVLSNLPIEGRVSVGYRTDRVWAIVSESQPLGKNPRKPRGRLVVDLTSVEQVLALGPLGEKAISRITKMRDSQIVRNGHQEMPEGISAAVLASVDNFFDLGDEALERRAVMSDSQPVV